MRIESKKGEGKGGRIIRCISPFALFSNFSKLVTLLDLFLELGSLVATSGLLFEADKFFAPLIEDLTPKPLKASILSFPGEQLLLFGGDVSTPNEELSPPSFLSSAGDRACSLCCYMIGLCALALPEVTTKADSSSTTLTLEALCGCTVSPLGYLGP